MSIRICRKNQSLSELTNTQHTRIDTRNARRTLTHTHAHTRTHARTHALTHSLTHSLSLSRTRTLTHTHTHTHTHARTRNLLRLSKSRMSDSIHRLRVSMVAASSSKDRDALSSEKLRGLMSGADTPTTQQ